MIDTTFTLEKKVAMVVGAANGIGRATGLAFAAAGAAATCADVEEADAKTTAAEIEKGGARALPVHLDMTEGASCRAAVAATVERFGGPNVLLYGAADSDSTATVLVVGYWASLNRRGTSVNVLSADRHSGLGQVGTHSDNLVEVAAV